MINYTSNVAYLRMKVWGFRVVSVMLGKFRWSHIVQVGLTGLLLGRRDFAIITTGTTKWWHGPKGSHISTAFKGCQFRRWKSLQNHFLCKTWKWNLHAAFPMIYNNNTYLLQLKQKINASNSKWRFPLTPQFTDWYIEKMFNHTLVDWRKSFTRKKGQ